MGKKYGIGLFTIALVLMAVVTYGYRAEYRYSQELVEEGEKEQTENSISQEKTVSTQGDAQKDELYYLKDLNGYVVVYMNDRTTVYEYTNILISDLPDTYQNEIKNGMIIEGTEKLYGFLENYSS
ncbi:hypothetical protein MR781_03675 [bacterium]|uniref:hypothetical protein n=1 Tax=Lachnospiraceae TaxID=186803 RepID=UPI002A254AD4|nr:hypothetical protein [bacterium]MDD6515114.1 hypothetical protein [bacterium]MDD7142317.1 hypothetical protein [bacterium]MDY4503878.1 hypothetical protein [Bariatricus sp.]MDY5456702.1 hypothetical protein [Bariatricus sp.]